MKGKAKGKGLGFRSVRVKLVTSLLSICLIPLIVVGIFINLQSLSLLSKKLEVTSNQTLSEINRGITSYFQAMSNSVDMLSINYDFINLEEHPEFTNFVQMLLKDTKNTDESIENVYYGTEAGKMNVLPEVKLPEGFDPRTRDWYKMALNKKGEAIVTPPYKSADSGVFTVTIARAVEKDGKVVGVVGMDLQLEKFSADLSNAKIGENGYVFVTDAKGITITHPKKEVIGKDDATKQSFWEEVKNNKSGFTNYKYEGEKKFGVYQTIELTGWKIIGAMPESELLKDTNKIMYTILFTVLLVGAIAVGISIILSNGISNNVKGLQQVIQKASQGDLTVSVNVKSKDEFKELGNSFNKMIENISTLMRNVGASSRAVLDTSGNLTAMAEQSTAAVTQVAQAMDEITIGATKQAESTLESATSMENLSDSLDSISNSTKEMGDISEDTQKLSSEGLVMVKELIEISNQTKNSSVEVGRLVEEVNNSMMQITAISDTISQITAKTNLLSLNATIEAARAGESGRGFAVVADEIRKLAEQSKNSTEEIKGIINEIQEKSIAAVEAMNETENVVNEQSQVVNKTEKIFDNILSGIFVLTDKVKEIQYSTEEIQHKKDDVVAQIENVSSISEETASATEEVSASTEEITATMTEFTQYAEQLQRLSQKLEEEVIKFKLND
jgi:methyl-accepting chemotaxis protein